MNNGIINYFFLFILYILKMSGENENIQDYGVQFFNPIDIFIDRSFDMLSEITNNKIVNIDKIENTINELKKKTDYTPIDTLIMNENTKKMIIEKIDSYMYMYMLLLLSFENDIDAMRKLLIKNEKIGTYVNNTTNISLLIDKAQLIQNFVKLINYNTNKKSTKDEEINIVEAKLEHANKAKEALYFYKEYVLDEETLKILSSKTKEHKHYILKIIILNMYQNGEKINIFKILEVEELAQLEYTFIEVVDSFIDEVDYSTVESLFIGNLENKNIASSMYDLLSSYDNEVERRTLTIDDKVNELFKNNILIPITDEFLRYHKESERYDKIDVDSGPSKKQNTKIKYIVTKINKVADYYNIVKTNKKADIDEVDKLLFPPLAYRKAVIVNEIEELNIINKIINQGKTLTSNEYYEDLLSYRKYPYINFKDANKDGFTFKLSDTKIAIRLCNFEFMNPTKNPSQYKSPLQIRSAGKDSIINIVGVAINPIKINNSIYNRLGSVCTKLNKTIDLSKNNSNNGYIASLSLLKKQISQDLDFKMLPYWLFNKKNDVIKIQSYENLSNINHEEYFKLLLAKIYDGVVNETYQKIVSEINNEKSDELFYYKYIINLIQSSLLNIEKSSQYDDLIGYLFYKKIGKYLEYKYDKNENKIPGLNSKLIKIPIYVDNTVKEAKITLSKEEYLLGKITEETIDEEFLNSLCQHQLSWNQINYYKKRDTNKFTQLLYEFYKKYSFDAGNHDEYLCKSCYESLDIKKYIADSFDNNLNNVTLIVPLEADLERLAEYEKFNKVIKNMDKSIERIASISNVGYYIGNLLTNKYRRQTIIKNVIDLINLQTQIYDVRNINMRKERLQNSNKLYGIDENRSSYFIFEMDNNLFTFSSKDVDKFKKYKNNNIFLYIIFMILSEMNLNQIISLTYDKLYNYTIFDKFSMQLFSELKIRINNGSDIKPITDYKLLCYVIYYFSSLLIKYNIWFNTNENLVSKGSAINPQLQKNIIHTIVDLINSILEVNTRKNKNFIYEMVSSKFLIKLKTVYENKVASSTLERLETITDKKIQVIGNKIKIKTKDPSLIISLEKSQPPIKYEYLRFPLFPGRFLISRYIEEDDLLKIMTLEQLNEFNKNRYMKTLEKIYENFGEDGSKFAIEKSSKGIDEKLLIKHAMNVSKLFLEKNNKNILQHNDNNKQIDIEVSLYNDYQSNYNKEIIKNNIITVVDNLIDKMEKIIGSNININNSNLYLKKKVYIIDHDHLGNKKEPMIILESDNKMMNKKDESNFKRDVYYYLDKSKNITIYYDMYELFLLGYKEATSNVVQLHKNNNNYLKINYSIRDQLLYLGHSNINIRLEYTDNNKLIVDDISNVIKTRIRNLKNIIKEFQSVIYQIKNKFNGYNVNPLVKQFMEKFKSFKYYDKHGNRIFEDWTEIVQAMYFGPLKYDINIGNISNNFLNVSNLVKLNNNDNSIIFYLCQQIDEIFNINNDSYNQTILVSLISLIISQLFTQYNMNETIFFNNEVRKFNLLVKNISYKDEENEVDLYFDEIDESKLSSEQKETILNENEDNKEAREALDTDIEKDVDVDDTDDGMDVFKSEDRDD